MKPMFMMMVGLPYSGKSCYAEKLKEEFNAVVHSSDAIREEILGDVQDQNNNGKVFDVLHRRVIEDLSNGRNVIYDATNINYKRRMDTIQRLSKVPCEKVCEFMATPFADCVERSKHRDRVVPYEVLERMYKSIWIPQYYEGWDKIHVIYPDGFKTLDAKELFWGENGLAWLDQDNPHHDLTVGAHCIATYANIHNGSPELYEAAMLHDIGKAFTKAFKNSKGEDTDIAHYYEHHHVSAYDSLFCGGNEMKCSICGKEVLKVNPCPYNKEYGFVCESCCEKCFQTEPFPCWEYIERMGDRYREGMFLHD